MGKMSNPVRGVRRRPRRAILYTAGRAARRGAPARPAPAATPPARPTQQQHGAPANNNNTAKNNNTATAAAAAGCVSWGRLCFSSY
jgi:hypothetical protein